MKVSICDLCNKQGKFVEAKYRIGYNGFIKVDVCEEHKNSFKTKNVEEFKHKLHLALA